MSAAQLLAVRFEVAHAAKATADPQRRARLLIKVAALDEKIKAEACRPPDDRICSGWWWR